MAIDKIEEKLDKLGAVSEKQTANGIEVVYNGGIVAHFDYTGQLTKIESPKQSREFDNPYFEAALQEVKNVKG